MKYVYNNITSNLNNETCPTIWFNHDTKEKCDKWIFDENERTIVNDVR
jgi:hypothetical protein